MLARLGTYFDCYGYCSSKSVSWSDGGGGWVTPHVLRWAIAADSCTGPRRVTRPCINMGYVSAMY